MEATPSERLVLRYLSGALLVACGLSWCFVGSAAAALAVHTWQNLGRGLGGMNGCFALLAVIAIVIGLVASVGFGVVGLLALTLGVFLAVAGFAHIRRGARTAAIVMGSLGLLASLALFGALVWPRIDSGLRLPFGPAAVAGASVAQVAAHLACVLAAYASPKPGPVLGR